jgi:hypothetical protein
MAATVPISGDDENLFQSSVIGERSTITRLLTKNSRTPGTAVSHHAHRGW